MKCLLLVIQTLFIVLIVGCSNKNVYIGELKDGKPHGKEQAPVKTVFSMLVNGKMEKGMVREE